MICPYCAEKIPANSQQHNGCRKDNNRFPLFYVDYHSGEGSVDPIVLSVVGFPRHGKTVYLCALFDYLDNHLTYMWQNFFNLVLDQESLSTLNKNRSLLRKGELPPPTEQNFPRPGIFRLTNMPHTAAGNGLPPFVDTTVLIYDPPGEAVSTEEKIVDFASFVKQSDCVLFLIDLTALGDSIADEMARLLDTYVLGMRRMGIEKQSQHMIVVYTKSDEIKVAVPEFERFLEREPGLRDYLDQQRPATLADPHAHLRQLADISSLLENFTWSELNAGRFIHVAKDWFASVSYTVVSSLGAAPEENPDEKGNKYKRLTVRMSPRGVADPLLYVLAKSIKEPQPQLPGPTPPDLPTPDLPTPGPPDWRILAITGGAAIIILIVLITLLAWAFSENGTNQNGSNNGKPNNNTKPSAKVPAPSGMVYVPGGEFIMGNASGDDFERPTHRTLVKPFFIDLYEVTCADYARFVEQTGHAPPPGWRNGQYPQGSARHPVAGVSWDDAVAYAQWANKRLPTEAEWEFAARGTEGRLYPWGNQWLAGMANAGSGGGPADVGVFKGVSPFGVYDMAGNVWEWTADDLRPYPGGQLPPVSQGILKVIRGGSWQESPGQASTTYRGYLLARGSKDYSATGLRCAQDATGTQGSGTDSSAR